MNFERIRDQYVDEPYKFKDSLTKREIEKRTQLVEDLIALIKGDLTNDYVAIEKSWLAKAAAQERQRYARSEDGKESEATENLDNRNIHNL